MGFSQNCRQQTVIVYPLNSIEHIEMKTFYVSILFLMRFHSTFSLSKHVSQITLHKTTTSMYGELMELKKTIPTDTKHRLQSYFRLHISKSSAACARIDSYMLSIFICVRLKIENNMNW